MKHCYTMHEAVNYIDFSPHAQPIQIPYVEDELLELQDAFFIPGIYAIKVKDQVTCRLLWSNFLNSYNYYSQVAYLSEILSPALCGDNIYAQITHASRLGQLEQYVGCILYCDILIIEASSAMRASIWFRDFTKLLADYGFISTMPIAILFYD